MKNMHKLFFSLFLILLLTGCSAGFQANDSAENNIDSSDQVEERADIITQRDGESTTPIVPPLPLVENEEIFDSNGDKIQGWYWIRNHQLTHYAEWIIHNIPLNQPSIELDFYVLATNRSSGSRGYDANFLLYYGEPGSDNLRSIRVVLPNVSSKSDPVGYDCRGQVRIPTADLGNSTNLYLKAVRTDKSDHHIAFKKESIVNIIGSALASESGNLAGNNSNEAIGSDSLSASAEIDSDGDGLDDSREIIFGLNKNNIDTDGDGVGDAEDLSPLINPSEPVLSDYHPKGIIRIEQPIKAIGFDGWVEKYHKVYPIIMSSYYVYDYTEENEGTKKSAMTYEKYKAALNKVFTDSNFIAYNIADKTPSQLYVDDIELGHDYDAEHDYTYLAGFFHPNEYRFYHDWITDYALAYLKNSESIKYPNDDNYFRLILEPLKLSQGNDQTISIQFKSNQTYQDLWYDDDNHYKAPAFIYTLYSSDDYDSDANTIIAEGLSLAMIEAEGRFQADIKIPKNKAVKSQVYLKIAPAWYVKNGNNENYEPMNLQWDVTGLSRSVTLLENSEGSRVITQEFKDWEGLNTVPVEPSYLSNKSSQPDYKQDTKNLKMIQFDPQKENEKYLITESNYDVKNYIEKSNGVASSFISQTENMITAHWKVDEIGDLPDTHWARSFKYSVAVGSLSAAGGVMSLVSDGNSAWTAYKDDNTVDVVYYSAQAGLDTVGTVASLTSITERTVGYAGKAGKLAKITTKKAAVGLAVAVGVVDISYNAYQLAETEDPILKLAYEEKIGASAIDTGISVAAVFSPHALAFQLTWTAEAEIYAMIFGEDFAYRIAQSPGSAAVFLVTYFITGGIDSTMAETAYLDARDELIDHLEIFNSVPLPYLTIFIDPDL